MKKLMSVPTIVLMTVLVGVIMPIASGDALAAEGPSTSSNLKLAAPIDRWDEAVPLGNGLLGGLLWGSGRNLKLSLDRGDLWDLRLPETFLSDDWTWATLRELEANGNTERQIELFEKPHRDHPYPTKLPTGRLELTLDLSQAAKSFELDLASATARVELGSGALEAFYSAEWPVAMIRISGPAPQRKLVAPVALKQLEYPDAQTGGDEETSWLLQEAAEGLKYAVVLAGRRVDHATEIALTVTSTNDDPDPLALGRRRVAAALDAGYDRVHEAHAAWWARFWSQSSVRVPDPAVQQQYDLVQYFYGAASRRGAPPMPLQGVWTADSAGLPPWHGDYHHDLNTQLTYWTYLAAGHFEEGASFLDLMWRLLPAHQKFAQDFYDAPGAAVVGIMTLDGQPIGGWRQYSVSPTSGAWVAQAFYLHWRYTMDQEFLTERAYPYCTAIGECLHALLEPGPDGKLKLPLSSSPEIHGNRPEAWLTPNSNYDLSLLRWLFGALIEMADATGDTEAAEHWQKVLDGLDPLAVEGEDGALMLSPDESLTRSHRHHSHLLPIHPLGTLHVEGSDRDRNVIDASLEQIEQLGTKQWCGYSFSWMACIAARCAKPDRALDNLSIFLKAFVSPNGFHLNGDYKRQGYSNFAYRPFTLEGNFAAGQAVHEMLLQSWGGVVRVFPAVPQAWADVAFNDLRAEGGFVVSARREKGATKWVRVRAGCGGTLKLRDPFGGETVSWNRTDVEKSGDDYQCTLRQGEILEGHL